MADHGQSALSCHEPSIAAGTVVGSKYQLESPIGEGASGAVWKASHVTLGRKVAVKILGPQQAAVDEVRRRFIREAKVSALLHHRNVVQVLDYGVLDGGRHPYIVMELLEGESLADRLGERSGGDEARLLELVGQVLGGLAAVHDAGILHRDLKPENIFIVRDSDGDYAKLIDFGISCSDSDSKLTRHGVIVGTPAYMSPEQARGRELDERTDLFSVGLILFEMFAGILPFDGDRANDVLIRVATTDMPALEQVRPGLPKAVYAVVDRAVMRDPAKRFRCARAMRRAVLEAVSALETNAPSEAAREHGQNDTLQIPMSGVPRRRHLVAGGALVAALVAGLGGFLGWSLTGSATDGIPVRRSEPDSPSAASLLPTASPEESLPVPGLGRAPQAAAAHANGEALDVAPAAAPPPPAAPVRPEVETPSPRSEEPYAGGRRRARPRTRVRTPPTERPPAVPRRQREYLDELDF